MQKSQACAQKWRGGGQGQTGVFSGFATFWGPFGASNFKIPSSVFFCMLCIDTSPLHMIQTIYFQTFCSDIWFRHFIQTIYFQTFCSDIWFRHFTQTIYFQTFCSDILFRHFLQTIYFQTFCSDNGMSCRQPEFLQQ
jgi:hypothetical protein